MKRLILTMALTFGLAFPASGFSAETLPFGRSGTCSQLESIMEYSRLTLVWLSGRLSAFVNADGDGLSLMMTDSDGPGFRYWAEWARTVTHIHDTARDAYESACVEDDK